MIGATLYRRIRQKSSARSASPMLFWSAKSRLDDGAINCRPAEFSQPQYFDRVLRSFF
jgi:hypothetical protein